MASPKETPMQQTETAPSGAPDDQEEASANAAPFISSPEEEELRLRITQLEEDAARLRDQYARAIAEGENIRKRAQREIEEASRYAITTFARDMVSVLENLQRASESVPKEKREENDLLRTIGEGVDLTLQELLGIFNRYGIKPVFPLNDKFDHNFHQAVVQVEREDVPPGTVVQVVQAGYVIQDRLLRPAMVAVSKAVDPSKKVDTTA